MPGAFAQAFHLMRSGRPGPVLLDLPFDVQMAQIEFDPDTYQPLPVYKPAASRAQAAKALDMLAAAQRPVIVAGGGIINADASDLLVQLAELLNVPVIPTLMGWGIDPGRSPVDGRHGRPANQSSVRERDDAGVRFRVRDREPVGEPADRRPGRVPGGPHVRARGHRAHPDRAGLRPGLRHRLRRRRRAGTVPRAGPGTPGGRRAGRPVAVGDRLPGTQTDDASAHPFREHPDQAAAGVRGDEQGVRAGHPVRVHDRPVADRGRAVPARVQAAALDQRRAGRAAGLDAAGDAGGVCGRPRRHRGRPVRRLRLPVHDGGTRRRRAVQPALHPRRW